MRVTRFIFNHRKYNHQNQLPLWNLCWKISLHFKRVAADISQKILIDSASTNKYAWLINTGLYLLEFVSLVIGRMLAVHLLVSIQVEPQTLLSSVFHTYIHRNHDDTGTATIILIGYSTWPYFLFENWAYEKDRRWWILLTLFVLTCYLKLSYNLILNSQDTVCVMQNLLHTCKC